MKTMFGKDTRSGAERHGSVRGAGIRARRIQRIAGLAFALVGVMLLALVGAYYAYGFRAKAAIGDYSSSQARPEPIGAVIVVNSEGPAAPIVKPAVVEVQSSGPAADTPARTETAVVHSIEAATDVPATESKGEEPAPTAANSSSQAAPAGSGGASYAAPVPSIGASTNGERAQPLNFAQRVRRDPEPAPQPGSQAVSTPTSLPQPAASASAEKTDRPGYQEIREQFLAKRLAVSTAEAAMYSMPANGLPTGGLAPATRIRIPVVGIDSEIQELGIIETDDSRAWETPKHVVGHIPTSAVPGGEGQGWYFGHLESPIRGEGNVFRKLPELAELVTLPRRRLVLHIPRIG